MILPIVSNPKTAGPRIALMSLALEEVVSTTLGSQAGLSEVHELDDGVVEAGDEGANQRSVNADLSGCHSDVCKTYKPPMMNTIQSGRTRAQGAGLRLGLRAYLRTMNCLPPSTVGWASLL